MTDLPITERDREDARGVGERSGLNMMDDWDLFMVDVAQTIANGRRLETANQWHPISTCPKERDVLLFNDLWDGSFGATQIGQIDHGGEWNFQTEMNLSESEDEFQPTHWQELPAPPVI